jgi:hypothetical protein
LEVATTIEECAYRATFCNSFFPGFTQEEQCVKYLTATSGVTTQGCDLLTNIDLCCNNTVTIVTDCAVQNETAMFKRLFLHHQYTWYLPTKSFSLLSRTVGFVGRK